MSRDRSIQPASHGSRFVLTFVQFSSSGRFAYTVRMFVYVFFFPFLGNWNVRLQYLLRYTYVENKLDKWRILSRKRVPYSQPIFQTAN